MKKKYHKTMTKHLMERCNVQGKKILEIGGDVSCSVAKYLVENGAAHVTSINIDSRFSDREVNNRISTKRLSATELTKCFAKETFDIVYGYAVLEHIDNTSLLLAEIYSVLKKNGFVYLHGGPIWTCARGHHIWVDCVVDTYRFNKQDKNPIPDWYHLILTPEEMKLHLAEKSISAEDADKIVHYIYDSSDICRIGHADLIEKFHQSELKMLEVIQSYGKAQVDYETSTKLKSMFQDKQHDFEVESVKFLLQKA